MASVGDWLAGQGMNWSGGVAEAQTSVTDLSAHVDGGPDTGAAGSNAAADTTILYWAAGIVGGALVLLWFLGGIVFKGVRV